MPYGNRQKVNGQVANCPQNLASHNHRLASRNYKLTTQMAQVTSPISLKGSIGNLIFSTRNGKTIAYQKPSFCLKKWRKSKSTKWARVSAQNFGGAAKCGSAIYKGLSIGATKGIFRPYSHNYIAKKLRANVYRRQPAADHYDLATAQRALKSLDLSTQESNSDLVHFKNIGPTHSPTQTKITGLKAAAYEIDPTGQSSLECRITRRTLRFPEVRYDKQAWKWKRTNPVQIRQHKEDLKSEWFHIDHIPTEGIKLSLSTSSSDPKEASLVFFIIEWRKPKEPASSGSRVFGNMPPEKIKYHQLKAQAIIRLAAIRITKEEAQAIANAPIPTTCLQTVCPNGSHKPAAPDLKTALHSLMPPIPAEGAAAICSETYRQRSIYPVHQFG